jgi:hypothetical protein
MEYYEEYIYEIEKDEISEDLEIEISDDELHQLKKDEKYEFTSKLYDFIENYIIEYNKINDFCINEQNINYLNFRKWIDNFLV